MTDVLPKGYAFFASNKADSSPQLDTLETIAANLEWSLCELLCETAPPVTIRPELIKLAVTAALRAIPSDRAEVIPNATVSALDILDIYCTPRYLAEIKGVFGVLTG